MAVYLGLFFISAVSSGVYVSVCGIAPVAVAYLGYKFLRWERLPGSAVLLIVGSAILMLVGWKCNVALMGGARGNDMTFCSVHQMLASISGCLFGMFELYGGATASFETRILSMEGIQILERFAVTAGMLVSGMAYAVRYIQRPGRVLRRGNLRVLLLLSVFAWNTVVLLVSFPRGGSATYEYRYHLIGMLPLMCAAVSLLADGAGKLREGQRNCVYAAVILAIAFMCAGSYGELFSGEDLHGDLKELCAFTKDLDVEHIYMFDGSNDADICRVIDETSSYICLLDDGRTMAYDYYGDYVGTPMQTVGVAVVVDEAKYQFGHSFEIAGHVLTRFAIVGNRSLYYFTDGN